MHSIQIDDQVFEELARSATGFNVTPNDVLRRLLKLPTPTVTQQASQPKIPVPAPVPSSLTELIASEHFQRSHQAIDRFLGVLAWLHASQPTQFAEAALAFHRGNRRYFAKSKEEVESSGAGITAKPIPQSPFWVLTTLDNKAKRLVIEDMLHALRYQPGDINLVLAELPDSDIRRHRGQSALLRSLGL
ncbi:MAG TPA: hypothetical protein VHY22_09570 [Chthoniobacteraceae bacterium]|jgi:negative regulator of replication initiation|nr:hypothetical protein [Chthoniobacteraceae bacterium]